MAKSKKKSKSFLPSSLQNPKHIVLAVIVSGFGVFGAYTLLKSKAAVISSVNGRIAYSCNESTSGGRDLCTVNPDGSAKKIIAYGTTNKWYLSSNWSPDGSKIAVVKREISSTHNTDSIFVINADGSNERKLTNPTIGTSDSSPVWSKDGLTVSFVRGNNIVTVNASTGTIIRNITPSNGGGVWSSFSFSPDNARIVYTSYDSGGLYNIYVANADGSSAKKINNNSGTFSKYPVWSPDGTKIAFVGNPGDVDDMFLVNPDGTNQVRLNLSSSMINGGKPAWSPDSKSFVYNAAQNQGLNIYTLGGSYSFAVSGLNADDPSWGMAPLIDGVAPSVTISSPTNGATLKLKGKNTIYTVKFSASDNVGVSKLELFIDGTLVNTVLNKSSGEYGWDLRTVSRGTHTLEVKASDSAGNVGTKSITVKK